MPSQQLPSSFASAAAGQGVSRDGRGSSRGDRGSGDWPRRDNRTANGTLTLRRSSTTPYGGNMNQPSQPDYAPPASAVEASYASQPFSVQSPDNNMSTRYSKESLLDIYRSHQESAHEMDHVTKLFVGNWEPGQSQANSNGRWGKPADSRDQPHGADICWDQAGQIRLMALEEMTPDDKIKFSDVNSTVKPPPSANKEQSTPGHAPNGRKVSISQGQGGAVGSFGMASPTSLRPGPRRRETSETLPQSGLTSPGVGNRFSRDDSSPYFSRRVNDAKDAGDERPEEPSSASAVRLNPLGSLLRNNASGAPLAAAPASPWGPTPGSGTLASPMGTFGNFSLPIGQPTTPGEKRSGFGSVRGESRLAHLMPKDNSDDMPKTNNDASRTWRPRGRTDTNPFDDDPVPTGSAALRGSQDSTSLSGRAGADFINKPTSTSAGMSDTSGFRNQAQRRDPPLQHGHEGLSDTETNPYGSPHGALDHDDTDDDHGDSEGMHAIRGQPLGGIPEHGGNLVTGGQRAFQNVAFDGSDRSQTSSAGIAKGFPLIGGGASVSGLPSLSGLGGWPTNPIGTPDRERSGFQGAFGSSLFSPIGDLQSPSLGNLGAFGNGPSMNMSGSNTIGRGSKLGSLFPAAMQAQMHNHELDNSNESSDPRLLSAFGTIGKNTLGNASRETDSPLRSGRGVFDDLMSASDNRNSSAFHGDNGQERPNAAGFGHAPGSNRNYQQSQSSSDSASGLPQTQQRTMVMPDRMRWVYLDPQGQTQGPWSGLEMHDWYKASFFTADLSVKKVEDADFEPLGQLIRRIGNSREPFLVPQIGVPHGPPSAQSGAPFAPTAAAPGASTSQSGSVQPPFAGAFPSFGTTLTAEQQNNLERRKQEEQYLMARQREFLAQQQVNMKQLQMQGGMPSALHHHSSVHSLQSQPSFGSITSPIGMPSQAQLPGVSAFFDGNRQAGPVGNLTQPNDLFREDDMARLSLQDRQQTFGASAPHSLGSHPAAQSFAQQMDTLQANEAQGNPRLREFEQLRAQHDAEQETRSGQSAPIGPPQARQSQAPKDHSNFEDDEALSLTEQVQKAASAKQTPALQQDSPWGTVGTSLPMPFPPPPQSTTPLPAPMAQRGRSDLAETLNLGTLSRSDTPDMAVTTPSVAPWAKEPAEGTKGPSLKEIQEAEAKTAARVEEAALAARRAAAELELRNQPVITSPAPGLPTSSTWAASGSPATPSGASPWVKPVVATSSASTISAAAKKTLADIQKEEENRKQKIAAATASAVNPGQTGSGKRYADLASKTQAASSGLGGPWATVGSGGKVKGLPVPVTSTAQPSRAVSTSTSVSPAMKLSKPAPTAARNVMGGSSNSQNAVITANQEFTKWAKGALAKGLNSDINVDEFVAQLSTFPAESAIIADSVYANSQLMDGRRFAEEYIRRRKLAEKGVVENASAASSGGFSTAGDSKGAGGWSEVAKKGPQKEEPTSGFKVVPNKKKGRK